MKKVEQSESKSRFASLLLKWNKEKNDRQMPWKGEKDPYKIWLSEIILQQTRVEQGLSYYNAFIKTFPDVHKLAKAPDAKVFKLWEGLGYYTRCRNLLITARFISKEKKGVFPDSYETIKELKGIGPYTAAAISSFAFNLPHAVVDGNVF
ncbi:MAG TPA: A/G-specific adenine glycosylase, partial [Chitinophagaceae bacterium]|nr:A/G-specific adenine glycosylase [Chitinophagaceae bacterium]